ncbi:hypothetical protein IL306_002996 [Fusarium sp. DS 682]|nr:hypothetical protein IL306_002996 [Fusarium sp. DS 682]
MAYSLKVSDRNNSYFRSDEIVDNVYDEVANQYIRNRTAPLINTVAFPSLRLASDDWKQFMNNSSEDGISAKAPCSMKNGYELQKKILREQIFSDDTGIFETMASS